MTSYSRIEVPRQGVNDDTVQVVEWLVADGDEVDAGQLVVVVETTKSAIDLDAADSGFVFHWAKVGDDVPVGSAVGVIASTSQRPDQPTPAGETGTAQSAGDGIVTAKARALISEHGLADDLFARLQVVRASDVEDYLNRQTDTGQVSERSFRGEALDPAAEWDEVLSDESYRGLLELLTRLRRRMKARYDRHVGTGDLLHDRWELAREYGFGEGTSVYDDCVIFGAVAVGDNSWVGPGCILDGSGGDLVIGHYVDISAGSHIYTHNTVERALTGHRAPIFHKATSIGNCCFIGPHSVLAPGTVLGDHCFVAAGSYVEGVFGDYSFVSGSPAKQVGTVEVTGDFARVRPYKPGTDER